MLQKDLIHIRGEGLPVWIIDLPYRSGTDRAKWWLPSHSLHNNFPFARDYFNFKNRRLLYYIQYCFYLLFFLFFIVLFFLCENFSSESTLSFYIFRRFSYFLSLGFLSSIFFSLRKRFFLFTHTKMEYFLKWHGIIVCIKTTTSEKPVEITF